MCVGLTYLIYHVGHHRLCAGLVKWATVVAIVYARRVIPHHVARVLMAGNSLYKGWDHVEY